LCERITQLISSTWQHLRLDYATFNNAFIQVVTTCRFRKSFEGCSKLKSQQLKHLSPHPFCGTKIGYSSNLAGLRQDEVRQAIEGGQAWLACCLLVSASVADGVDGLLGGFKRKWRRPERAYGDRLGGR
jgi:hypothetical protein